MQVLEYMARYGYEQVVLCHDAGVGLRLRGGCPAPGPGGEGYHRLATGRYAEDRIVAVKAGSTYISGEEQSTG